LPENLREIWEKALETIKTELGNDQSFNIWFKPIRAISLKDGVVKLEVPNNFAKTWLLDKHMPLIYSSLGDSFGPELKIEIEAAGPGD